MILCSKYNSELLNGQWWVSTAYCRTLDGWLDTHCWAKKYSASQVYCSLNYLCEQTVYPFLILPTTIRFSSGSEMRSGKQSISSRGGNLQLSDP